MNNRAADFLFVYACDPARHYPALLVSHMGWLTKEYLEEREATLFVGKQTQKPSARHFTAELGVRGAVHLAHSALTDRGGDPIVGKRAADQISPPEPSVVSCGFALNQGSTYFTPRAFRNCAAPVGSSEALPAGWRRPFSKGRSLARMNGTVSRRSAVLVICASGKPPKQLVTASCWFASGQ
jgi:hypothetical protein